MPLTRRQVIAGTAAAALAGGGIYELVERTTGGSSRAAATTAARREQHLLDGLRIVRDNGVEVVVPPLHMQVVTLELTTGDRRADLQAARAALEDAIVSDRAPLPPHARRDRHHRRLGAALLQPDRAGARRDPPAGRPAGVAGRRPRRARPARRGPLPQRPGRDRPRGERRGAPPSERQPRDDRRCGARARERARHLAPDQHPAGVRGRRLRRRRGTAPDAGARGRRPGRPAHPRGSGALPGLHLDPARRPRPGEDRQPRDAGLRRRRPAGLLHRRHDDAPLAHLRGPRGVVSGLRLRPADRDALSPRPAHASGHAHGRARAPTTSPRSPRTIATTTASARSGTARRSRRRHA